MTQAIVQPRRAPVRTGSVDAAWEALHELAVVGDGPGSVTLDQVHVATGVERFLQPTAVWVLPGHAGDQGVLLRGVTGTAREFCLQICF